MSWVVSAARQPSHVPDPAASSCICLNVIFRRDQSPTPPSHDHDLTRPEDGYLHRVGGVTRPDSDPHAAPLKARMEFGGFVAGVYVLPPILLLSGVIPFRHRYTLLMAVTVLAAVYVWLRGDGLAALGLRKDNLRASARYNLGITLVALLVIAALYFSGVLPLDRLPPWRWFFLFYVLVSCPAQEFLFRSALFAEMDRANITSRGWQVALSSLLYCYPHVIYRSMLTLIAVLVIGIVWGYGFSRYRNFWGVAASHCILGTISVLSGLI